MFIFTCLLKSQVEPWVLDWQFMEREARILKVPL